MFSIFIARGRERLYNAQQRARFGKTRNRELVAVRRETGEIFLVDPRLFLPFFFCRRAYAINRLPASAPLYFSWRREFRGSALTLSLPFFSVPCTAPRPVAREISLAARNFARLFRNKFRPRIYTFSLSAADESSRVRLAD